MPPTLLTIAGFDPSSGAGVTADLKVFSAFGAFGVACPTALTVQSTQGVQRMEAVSPVLVQDTLTCLSDDILIDGVKIGMLAEASVVYAVVEWLRAFRARHPAAPVVLDPVLRSSSGRSLLAQDALPLFCRELLPLVSVVTPNLAETAELAGAAITDLDSVEVAARLVLGYMSAEGAVVVTGGHFSELSSKQPTHAAAEDLLLTAQAPMSRFPGEWVETTSTHGTGCAFSSALAALLVQGAKLPEAVEGAKRYLEGALRAAYPVGHGRGPMHHLFPLSPLSREFTK